MKNFSLIPLFCILALYVSAQSAIAYYPFVSDAPDASGNGYNGTLHGNAIANDTLVIGDNATDYVSLPDSLLAGLNDFTITFIVKFSFLHTIGDFPANTIIHAWGTSYADELKVSYN